MLFEELIPTIVPPVSLEEATGYANLTLRRMRNPFIEHQLSAINQGAATKWQTRLIPAIELFEERKGFRPVRIDECLSLFRTSQGS
jgi:tagaturonate reductase